MNTTYKNIFDLTGKTAIITGGGGNLGPHFGQALSDFGANIVLVDVVPEGVKKGAQDIQDNGGKALGLVCDITDPDSVESMVEKAATEFGGVHILMNNAASKTDDLKAYLTNADDYSMETWRKVMEVNIDAMFLVAQKVSKKMIAQKQGGSIIQTSTHYALNGPDFRIYEGSFYMGEPISQPPVYATSKAAVLGLTRYLASYWAQHNIRVNSLVPGGISTGQNNEFHERYMKNVPLNRMALIEDMVGAVVYLASNASAYMTGQEIIVDGGWTRR